MCVLGQMRARITQGIARRVAKLVNPLIGVEAKRLAKESELSAQQREQHESLARYRTALDHGVAALPETECAKLTLAHRTVIAMPKIASPEEWQKVAIESQSRLMEDVRK